MTKLEKLVYDLTHGHPEDKQSLELMVDAVMSIRIQITWYSNDATSRFCSLTNEEKHVFIDMMLERGLCTVYHLY